ncbi:centriole, cilia and spindle-associated protein isoform X2 [Monodon monoceros]|uniref:Centriole, cilia and spindle-associated protein isoform X1 n=1 Tax=Delphinapterus leucas TaxID=9749 RepID=A0A2Y9LPG1_DELLE|nr:centriole, cilia and spindle-associated protein isoform X1 [Delphinapterus leucas]XP_029100604.1 centriole, cilia and spindle-associated protein isoform X2 [Monodon monoceros]
MSPGSGVKSEYMKRYQEPRWDEYGPCYRALLHYRLGRRLLEQAHAPWLWDDWGPACASDDSASSASSGAGAPAPQCAPASPPPPVEPAAREEPEQRARAAPEEERGAEAAGDAEARDAEAAEDSALPALPVKDIKEKPERQIRTREPDKLPSSTEPQPPPSALPARGSRRAVKSPQRSSTKIKEPKHPFALYGWGEKQTDTGSQKTHNVCASAPVHESDCVSPAHPSPGGLVLLGLSPGVSLCEGLRTRQMRGPHVWSHKAMTVLALTLSLQPKAKRE